MAVYQIYKILFNRSRQGNMLSKMDGRTAYDKAKPTFDHKTLAFEFPNGLVEMVKIDKHLNV